MRTTPLRRTVGLTSTLLLATATLVACSSDDDTTASAGEGVLAGVCPDTVIFQADWEPEAEHGGIYELIGEEYEIDTNAKSVTGPLVASGEDTGVDIEIRIGGSSVGYQSAQSLQYQDRDILFGYGRVTEYMVAQENTPVTAVLASMETSPYSIYWDPETYPDVTSIADLNAEGVTVSVGPEDGVWIEYLLGTGMLDESQLDFADQNKPAKFVAAGGEIAEAGFITAEPFMYEEEIPEWGRPVIGETLDDAGYPEYFQAVTVRSSEIAAQADCLAEIVPIMQQAQVDYIQDPAETNALIIELVDAYDTGWVYTEEGGDFAHATAVEQGILGDGPDGVSGSFDLDRVQELIDIVEEYSDADVTGITPEDLVTNEFLDESISTEN